MDRHVDSTHLTQSLKSVCHSKHWQKHPEHNDHCLHHINTYKHLNLINCSIKPTYSLRSSPLLLNYSHSSIPSLKTLNKWWKCLAHIWPRWILGVIVAWLEGGIRGGCGRSACQGVSPLSVFKPSLWERRLELVLALDHRSMTSPWLVSESRGSVYCLLGLFSEQRIFIVYFTCLSYSLPLPSFQSWTLMKFFYSSNPPDCISWETGFTCFHGSPREQIR